MNRGRAFFVCGLWALSFGCLPKAEIDNTASPPSDTPSGGSGGTGNSGGSPAPPPPPSVGSSWPRGIPPVPFGLQEQPPASPSFFYYIDESRGTDTNNMYGSSSKPRRTIPNVLPAGAVVEIHGVYSQDHSSPRMIGGSGTVQNPIFIRGTAADNPAVITNAWEVKGSYIIFDFLKTVDADGDLSGGTIGSIGILAPAHHVALRNSEITGNLQQGGVGLSCYDGTSVHDVLIYKNKIHHNGDYQATYDQDQHGILVGQYSSYVWVLENEMHHNSGDGIQIGGNNPNFEPHHIYVARNHAWQNKQTGFWSKIAFDVVFSENEADHHVPSGSSPGAGMGFQYDGGRIWYLFNYVHDNTIGIRAAGEQDGIGLQAYYVGNTIARSTEWAIDGWNSGFDIYAVNNTIYGAGGGLSAINHRSLAVINNIISGVSGDALDVSNSVANRTTIHHNLFGPEATRIYWNSSQYSSLASFRSATGLCLNCLNASPLFVNSAADDFRLSPSSPAVDSGGMTDVFSTFSLLYGLDISPGASPWDMGAF